MGEEEGFNTEWATTNRIGWQLKALRFKKGRNETTKKRERFWTITADAFTGLCQAYGLIKMVGNSKVSFSKPDTPMLMSEMVKMAERSEPKRKMK